VCCTYDGKSYYFFPRFQKSMNVTQRHVRMEEHAKRKANVPGHVRTLRKMSRTFTHVFVNLDTLARIAKKVMTRFQYSFGFAYILKPVVLGCSRNWFLPLISPHQLQYQARLSSVPKI
jgi:hypothetical protein